MDTVPDPKASRTSPLLVALAWAIVSAPLGWGVYESVVKALPLFQPAASTPPTPGR